MSLVNELQESAERDDVLTVLRKAKRLCSKLSREDISEWLDHEQNGYPDVAKVPEYRTVPVSFHYNTNGYVPAGYGLLKSGIMPLRGADYGLTVPVIEPIGTVISWVSEMKKGGGGAVYKELHGDIADRLRARLSHPFPEVLDQLTFLAKLNESNLYNIPEQVKNRVLDWSCKLEKAGVTGEGQSFTANERRLAQSVIFNVSGDLDQSNQVHVAGSFQGAIQTASPNAIQNLEITADAQLMNALKGLRQKVLESDLEELDKDEVNATLERVEELTKRPQNKKSRSMILEKITAVVGLIHLSERLATDAMPLIDRIRAFFHP